MRHEAFGRSPADAPTLLVSAGLGGLASFWQPQAAALAERFHVIAYDHRGTGANAGPLPASHAVSAMADDVVAILDDAKVHRCHFMGHALGGLVGLELALRSPARLRSLVLVNAWDRVSSHTRRCFDARLALLQHVGPEAYVKAQPIFLYSAAWLARNEARVAREEAAGLTHFQGAETLRARIDALLAFDVSAHLARIAVPTLVVGTRDDVLVPYTCSQALAAGIPGAGLWLAAEGGHASCATDPEPFNATVVAFLSEVST